MSIYMSIRSAEKETEVDLPSNEERKYRLEVCLHHPAGRRMKDVIEIRGVNRKGEESEVVVRVSDLLSALAHVLLPLEGWEVEDFLLEDLESLEGGD